ncbi:MAG: metallophosphoesterase [Planctomycetales bacterium]|nr:metallophosphoesterase [Planctomycetales bacterium]
MNVWLYNAIMLAIVVGALSLVRQQPAWRTALSATIFGGAGMVVCSLVLSHGGFGALALLSYGIFLHGTLFLAGTAVLVAKASKRLSAAAVLGCLSFIAVAVDAFLIEPTWLEVTRHTIRSPKLERPLKIVVLADLQTDVIGEFERRVFEQIRAEQPDMILCAGDYLQTGQGREHERELSEQLNRLLAELPFAAPLGVYLVEGNVDSNRWTDSFDGLPVTLFRQTRSLDLPRDDLRLTGLSMNDSFSDRVEVAASDRFHICLGHCPNFALGPVAADLMVAGHVHGGQVRLPLVGPLMTLCRVPRRWAVGLSRLDEGRRLLVSRGVGMERNEAPRIRFLCRPELVVLDLLPESSD